MEPLVVEIAHSMPLFTTDTLESAREERGGRDIFNKSAYGGLMTWAEKNRIIEKTGNRKRSRTNHRGLTVWRSLICEEATAPLEVVA